jgi:cell division septation protein DedD
MRDTHRLKEKYEVSLDSRQIVTLTVASMIVLGGVFVLGVVVGKKLSSEGGVTSQTTDILSAADQKTEALALAEKQPSTALTFQEELTRRSTPTDGPLAPKAEPREVSKLALLPAEPSRPAPTSKNAENKGNEGTLAPKLSDTPKDEPVPTRTNDAGALKEAFGKAQRSADPTPTPQPPATADGSWTLQLSAYQEKSEAERFAAGLKDKGYAPFIVEATIPGKGTWYRVRLGKFGSREAATSYLSDLKRETSINGMVTNH